MNIKYTYFLSLLILICNTSTSQDFNVAVDSELYNYLNLKDIPFQPAENNKWGFIEEVNKPLWNNHSWKNLQTKGNYVNLSSGITLKAEFPDPENLLETAYEDLLNFFEAGNVKSSNGNYIINTHFVSNFNNESFKIEVNDKRCLITASDIEGIRRGIFYIEDEMLRNGGAFLPAGSYQQSPVLKHRISRCFFGPIKRPGNLPGLMLGDELLDTKDYYPDNYLNRLAHEGVNGLWITLSSKMGDGSSVGFGDLVSTSITTYKDPYAEKRIVKLQSIVKKCKRYGIRIYLKTMEPHVPVSAIKDSVLKIHPDILGNGNRFLCVSNKIGQQYLYEAVNKIFKAVPDLGGIINISHGELYTTCLSALPATGGGHIDCPNCSKIPQWEILSNSLSAMKWGMEEVSPEAELISWLYMPQPQTQNMIHTLADWVYTIPAHTPEGVILQFNFESGVRKTVFGKELIGGDYWIAAPGPSSRFERIAEIARENNTRVSAKIQTGASYSVATVPFVPVPSLIYEKFSAMRRLGVSATMLNWIVGASPGLMNKAAGILSFEPFPENEDDFLLQLASIYWNKEDIQKVITAWKLFSEGYKNYPLDNKFQYFGPMNDGPVWPLLLTPLDMPLSPTYQLGDRNTGKPWLPSGDRIGESFPENLTFAEMVELCKNLSDKWDQGVEILNEIKHKYAENADRISDIGLAQAIGIQFRSGYNILHFYYLRDEMFNTEDNNEQILILNQIEDIIKEEIESGKQLINLCKNDPRLGYHADAEGYKYFPEKIQWRINFLQKILTQQIPEFEVKIKNNELLFPDYSGKSSNIDFIIATQSNIQIDGNSLLQNLTQYNWQPFTYGDKASKSWAINYDDNFLYILISYSMNNDIQKIKSPFTSIRVKVQPRRLWPVQIYNYNLTAEIRNPESSVKWNDTNNNWVAVARIPLTQIGIDKNNLRPVRLDVSVQTNDGKSATWRENNPYLPRLMLKSDNPNDLGWIKFE
ncbi:MAG: hypothetical protein PHN68_07880 [Prolixibacteraceae bacterium]|nr:hypothetical protein [Prolixibacteraceae bacterium]